MIWTMSKQLDCMKLTELGMCLQESGIFLQRLALHPENLDWGAARSEVYLIQKWASQLAEMVNFDTEDRIEIISDAFDIRGPMIERLREILSEMIPDEPA